MQQKIVFMGTPDFAVESLRQIKESGIEIAALVTAPDRPAGRGQKLRASAVKQFAVENELKVLQPENLKDQEFIDQLQAIGADLFVVVAFRMLPEVVWSMPPKGTINLHGSLLPQYRGAAPINWAVINGEQKTGATTFFIQHKIDTGHIIDQVDIPIAHEDTAGTVHDRMMVDGAKLLVNTIQKIFKGEVETQDQEELIKGSLKEAPKIFKADCKINWKDKTIDIYNKIRGLSPYPTAWTELQQGDQKKSMKIFKVIDHFKGQHNSGKIIAEHDRLYFGTADGWIEALEVQLEGKKRMSVSDFLKGFDVTDWTLN